MAHVHVPAYLPIAIDATALAAIAERHQVQELALFGSVLRDDFTAESDIDVLITFQPDRPFLRLFELFDMQFALEDLFLSSLTLCGPGRLTLGDRFRVGRTGPPVTGAPSVGGVGRSETGAVTPGWPIGVRSRRGR